MQGYSKKEKLENEIVLETKKKRTRISQRGGIDRIKYEFLCFGHSALASCFPNALY